MFPGSILFIFIQYSLAYYFFLCSGLPYLAPVHPRLDPSFFGVEGQFNGLVNATWTPSPQAHPPQSHFSALTTNVGPNLKYSADSTHFRVAITA